MSELFAKAGNMKLVNSATMNIKDKIIKKNLKLWKKS